MTDRWTDMMKLTDTFWNFANTPTNGAVIWTRYSIKSHKFCTAYR